MPFLVLLLHQLFLIALLGDDEELFIKSVLLRLAFVEPVGELTVSVNVFVNRGVERREARCQGVHEFEEVVEAVVFHFACGCLLLFRLGLFLLDLGLFESLGLFLPYYR